MHRNINKKSKVPKKNAKWNSKAFFNKMLDKVALFAAPVYMGTVAGIGGGVIHDLIVPSQKLFQSPADLVYSAALGVAMTFVFALEPLKLD